MQRKAYPMTIPLPGLSRLGSADLFIPLMLILAVVLPLVLAFMGVGIRTDKHTPLVINEIFVLPADPQAGAWIELRNNTDAPINVDGWRVSSLGGEAAQLQGTVAPHSFMLVRTQHAWSAASDAVILYGVDGDKVDAINWGPAPENSPIVDWNSRAALAPKANASLGRNPQGFDTDTGKDWRVVRPSPNTQSPASLNTGMYRLLFDVTNYVSLIAGFVLWGAFILIGLIAKRFEMLTGQRSYWSAMLVAPIGIVIYNAIQGYGFFTAGSMSYSQQLWAFAALFVSAAAMAYVVYRFYGIARRILEV